MSSRHEMEAAFEALLFVASEPVPRADFEGLFPDAEKAAAEEALAAVLGRYADPEGRGVMVDEVAGGVRLVTRPEMHGYLASYFESAGASRISVAALEALITEEGKDIGITVFPDVGHSLATWKGLLSVGFVPGYLDTLAAWTAEQLQLNQ